ncbi:hypothetical protein PIGHUM_00996 [Pigmentiphaga humi]|uniref:Uncharacterized protein n=1 Tax=Pigmentiphaga humi TaxID=2478468 RepID=A0A3P4AY24_9BURK|nr:hypothetical protein [Pigmentiphaga humi]VCU68937.1 hypothetical protein PIGHUM_00996 [Pigmentiphaga humi]
MNFNDLIQRFAAQAPGTDSFLKVKEGALALVSSDSRHAAAYFLIYGFARSYVILYEDQGIDPAFAETAKSQLLSYMTRLQEAFKSDAPADIVDAMNWIVLDYGLSGKIF